MIKNNNESVLRSVHPHFPTLPMVLFQGIKCLAHKHVHYLVKKKQKTAKTQANRTFFIPLGSSYASEFEAAARCMWEVSATVCLTDVSLIDFGQQWSSTAQRDNLHQG